MTNSLLVQSAEYLSKAVPLMMKYKVPTTPTNYAVWYAYVSHQLPALNVELDYLIDRHKMCPPLQSEALYPEFIGFQEGAATWALRKTLDQMLIQLDHSVTDTQSDTSEFKKAFTKIFDDIEDINENELSLVERVKLLEKIETDMKKMYESTDFFTEKLNHAKAEISTLKTELKKSQTNALYD
ncbi:MAG TPA: hypothetical protein EYH12_02580 [Psychromonas hadalis]|nr:hypothetical protein [Psychromonas hadalis]